MFNTVSLEIAARCNRSCEFCPVAYYTRPDESMDPAVLRKALQELGSMRYGGRIELYIYNEPARDLPYLLRVLAQARAAVPRACLMVATNGDYLRGPENIMALYEAGLNQLLINCYSPGLYAKRLPWLKALPDRISRTKGVYAVLSRQTRTVQMLDKSQPATFGTGIFRLINRAGNVPEFLPALAEPVARMCVKPFRILNINWQGEALLCCNDYYGQLKIGNVRDLSLMELWQHPVMRTYRKHLQAKDRSLPLCRSCDCHAGAYPHNVEKPKGPYLTAKEIEQRWQQRKTKSGSPSLLKITSKTQAAP